jgi:ABC-type multidrug transport system ATPase subunit
VLKNLNLNVPTGAMYGKLYVSQLHLNLILTLLKTLSYGLLGPSGCGKTTILRCVVGRASLDKGRVNVFGAEPCSKGHGIPGSLVGYMPQVLIL